MNLPLALLLYALAVVVAFTAVEFDLLSDRWGAAIVITAAAGLWASVYARAGAGASINSNQRSSDEHSSY